MDVTSNSKLGIRLQHYLFLILFLSLIGMGAWLSTRYTHEADWTASGRHSLSSDSHKLLSEMQDAISITAFARENGYLRKQIEDFISRYQRQKADINLSFVNPDTEPDRVRDLGISMDGELLLHYQGRSEHVQELSEQALTNALLRIARQGEHWIVFTTGHGERNPQGQANHDFGQFGTELMRKGLKVQNVNLAKTGSVPQNTHVLVIASPQVKLLPGEVRLVRQYLEQGGNLLWLTDPGGTDGLDALAEYLGIEFLPGLIVDASTQMFGIQDPSFVLVPDYPLHPVTQEMNALTLFPKAQALKVTEESGWQSSALLTSLERAWTETGELSGEIRYDSGTDEQPGPLDISFALTRSMAVSDTDTETDQNSEQRVIITGDGDFLSNAFLGNGANLDLGINMIEWLSHDDAFIAIRAKSAPDQTLELTPVLQAVIGFGFLLILPSTMVIIGVTIWLRRRKR